MLRLIRQVWTPYLDPFRMEVVGGADPLARAAAEIAARFTGPMATKLGQTLFGVFAVDDVYLDPHPLPVAAAAGSARPSGGSDGLVFVRRSAACVTS